jgi:Zn-dependent protease
MIVLSSLAGFGIGWGKPVQVNPYAFRTTPRAGMGIVAIAGPISNLILATLAAVILRVLGPNTPELLYLFLFLWVQTNVALALFNLIPVFPLDGYNILLAILEALKQDWSFRLASFWQKQLQYGPTLLLLLLVVDRIAPALSPISWVFGAPMAAILGILL